MKKYLTATARYYLGLIFLVGGLNGFLQFLPVKEYHGNAQMFIGALLDSGFLYVVKSLEIAAALLLLSNRYVRLGLTILGPIAINIFLFHLLMDRELLPLAIVNLLAWGFLMWQFRSLCREVFSA